MLSTHPIPPTHAAEPENLLLDSHGRIIRDLRVSITDRCNYRCVYCRTGEGGSHYAELATDEYIRLIRVFVSLGINKLRLTGGEPLLRTDLPAMLRELALLRTPAGDPLDLALTTNGHLLAGLAQTLADSGLQRVTVSMDAVDAPTFDRITRVPGSHGKVLAGIRAAQVAGLGPVKVNCVLLRGFNDDQILPFAHFARQHGVIVRFIEFMPLEEGRLWTPAIVVSHDEILQRISADLDLIPLAPTASGETARRYGFRDGRGEIGIIAPVTQAFCGACSRIRLTSDGKIRTCLFSHREHDLAGHLRRGATDEELRAWIRQVVHTKEARHHIGEPGFHKPSRSMVHIGG